MTAEQKAKEMLAKIGESLPADKFAQFEQLLGANEKMMLDAMPNDVRKNIEVLDRQSDN